MGLLKKKFLLFYTLSYSKKKEKSHEDQGLQIPIKPGILHTGSLFEQTIKKYSKLKIKDTSKLY